MNLINDSNSKECSNYWGDILTNEKTFVFWSVTDEISNYR